ncbi:MAG: hypothetical protein NTV94_03805 [Planctomycetota bacterium]|nr:hypothetical protein [Planctomycetota bacterium]
MTDRSKPSQADLYLDGLMTAEQAALFERELANNPALSAEVDLQRRIDQSIARQYSYPANSDTSLPEPKPIPFRPKAGPNWIRTGALGAVAACVTIACWMINPFEPAPVVVPQARLSACDVYTQLEMANWVPSFKCKSDDEFVAAVAKRLGSGMLIPLSTVGVTLDGWGYADGYVGSPLSKDTMYLLTHVGDQRVLVLMDLKKNDAPITKGACCTKVFRREVGPFVLYEITPNTEAKAIDAAVIPGEPAQTPATPSVRVDPPKTKTKTRGS